MLLQEQVKKSRKTYTQNNWCAESLLNAGFFTYVTIEWAAYIATHKPKTPTQPLFYTQRKDGFTANTLTHIVNGIYKNAGISGATSHSGRRTGLTNLSERGVGVRTLMAIAGHVNMSTTQRYIDMRTSVIREAIELV